MTVVTHGKCFIAGQMLHGNWRTHQQDHTLKGVQEESLAHKAVRGLTLSPPGLQQEWKDVVTTMAASSVRSFDYRAILTLLFYLDSEIHSTGSHFGNKQWSRPASLSTRVLWKNT